VEYSTIGVGKTKSTLAHKKKTIANARNESSNKLYVGRYNLFALNEFIYTYKLRSKIKIYSNFNELILIIKYLNKTIRRYRIV